MEKTSASLIYRRKSPCETKTLFLRLGFELNEREAIILTTEEESDSIHLFSKLYRNKKADSPKKNRKLKQKDWPRIIRVQLLR